MKFQSIICIAIFLMILPVFAQKQKSYYPSWGHQVDNNGKLTAAKTPNVTNGITERDQGKWATDTISCYLIQNHTDVILNQIIDTVFTQAAQVINNMGANIHLIKRYADQSDRFTQVGTIRKNLIGFGEDYFDQADTITSGTTSRPYLPVKKDTIHQRYYTRAETYKYIQLRLSKWRNGSLAIPGDPIKNIEDARSVMVHELMHFIGFGRHDAPRESVMSNSPDNVAGWINAAKPFNPSFFTLDAIYARALYPKILPKRPDGNDRNLNNAPR